MLSAEAARIRDGLERESVDPTLTPEIERRLWDEAAAGDTLALGTNERFVVLGGVSCAVIEPALKAWEDQVVVFVHGGGFVTGSITTHRSFASRIARAVGSDLVIVDYRLLPENPFPAPLNDVVAVVKALTAAAEGEPRREVVLAGDSSGAALAMSTACMLRNSGDPPIHGVVSFSGAFDATLSGDSIDAGCDPQLTRAVLEHWADTIGRSANVADPLVSPLHGDVSGLPPVLLFAGECEAWLSDSISMAERINRAGGRVRLEVFDAMWHVWPMYGDFPEAKSVLRSMRHFIDELRDTAV